MSPYDRETYAVIGTTAFAMIIAIGSGVLIPFIGFVDTAVIFGTVCAVYLIVTGMLRLTTRPLRAPVDDDDDEED